MNLRMTRRHLLNWLFIISWLVSNWMVYLKYGGHATLVMDVIWMLILLGLVMMNVQENWKAWMDKSVTSRYMGGMVETNQDLMANFFALGWLSTNFGFYLLYGRDALIFTNVIWLALGAFMVWMKRKSGSFNKWLKEKVYYEKEQ